MRYRLTDISEVFTALVIRAAVIALMTEALRTSEMSVNFCETALRKISEGSHLHNFNMLL
jgi:hypothetical protein